MSPNLQTAHSLCSKTFGNVNFFGGPSITLERVRDGIRVTTAFNLLILLQDALLEMEGSDENALFVVLSDVWFDRPQV